MEPTRSSFFVSFCETVSNSSPTYLSSLMAYTASPNVPAIIRPKPIASFLPMVMLDLAASISRVTVHSSASRAGVLVCRTARGTQREPRQLGRNAVQRQNLVDRAGEDRFARHPEHHAARFVLRERARTGLLHGEQSRRAVGAHARENRSHRIRPGLPGDRLEQHVHRRPLILHPLAVANHRAIPVSGPLDRQMIVARSDQHPPRLEPVALFGFLDAHPAALVQTPRELRGKYRRDVLRYDNGRHLRRQ